jgi:hypothetical protein
MSDIQRKNNPKYKIGDMVRINNAAKSGVVRNERYRI